MLHISNRKYYYRVEYELTVTGFSVVKQHELYDAIAQWGIENIGAGKFNMFMPGEDGYNFHIDINAVSIKVEIYDEEAAMAFKLRWF